MCLISFPFFSIILCWWWDMFKIINYMLKFYCFFFKFISFIFNLFHHCTLFLFFLFAVNFACLTFKHTLFVQKFADLTYWCLLRHCHTMIFDLHCIYKALLFDETSNHTCIYINQVHSYIFRFLKFNCWNFLEVYRVKYFFLYL